MSSPAPNPSQAPSSSQPTSSAHQASPAAARAPSLWRQVLPGVVISLLCLAFIFYVIDPSQTWQALLLADYRYVLLGAGASLLWLLVRAQVWRSILKDQAYFSTLFLAINAGYLMNNLLPLRLGEVGRAWLVSRQQAPRQLRFWEIIPSIVIERTLDIGLAAAVLLLGLPFALQAAWSAQAALVSGLVVLAGLAALYVVARQRSWIEQKLGKTLNTAGGWRQAIWQRVPPLFDGLAIVAEPRRFLQALGWMTLNWLVASVMFWLQLRAFFPQAQWYWALVVLGASSLGIAAPSTPGAVGVYELAVVGSLALLVDDPSHAAAFALVSHLINYILTGAIGAYALTRQGESLGSLFQRLRGKTPEAS